MRTEIEEVIIFQKGKVQSLTASLVNSTRPLKEK
jgi:hypothetical protein